MVDYSMKAQKAAFAEARLEIAHDLTATSIVPKLENFCKSSFSVSGEAGTALPIVARYPYESSDNPEGDIDPILINGYEYRVGFENLSNNGHSRRLWPVLAVVFEAEPIPLQPEMFTPSETHIVEICIDKLAKMRRQQFPFLLKDLCGFII